MSGKISRDKYDQFKPRQLTYKEKVREDSSFLISLIQDPVYTFHRYGFKADQQMLDMLHAVASDIRKRATALFEDIDIIGPRADNACNACEGCNVC